MSAIIRSLFEDTPRPGPLPTFPFPNDHPFAVRWKDLPGLPVPVGVGPLSTYHEHLQIPIPGDAFDRMEEVIAVPVDETEDVRKTPASTENNGEKVEHLKIPIPGEPGAPSPWTLDSPSSSWEGPPTPSLANNADCIDSISPDPLSPPPAPYQLPTRTYKSRKEKGLAPLIPPVAEISEVNWLQSAPHFPTASRRNLREQRCGRSLKRFWK